MAEALTHSIPRSVWYGWGDPGHDRTLPPAAWTQLRRRLGVRPLSRPRRPVDLADVRLPASGLTDEGRAALESVVGARHVLDDREELISRAGGKSWPDLYRLWTGDGRAAADVVVLPGDADEVARVLAVCAEHRIAMIPRGGGTSVVGGLTRPADAAGLRGVALLDLQRLDRMLHCDPISRLATFQPGLRGPDIEAALHPLGLTLGHYPQSHQEATFGGYLATRSAGQASTGYGRPDQHVVGLRLAAPTGELVIEPRTPASAAGPRLLDLVLGSEGAFGVITQATVRVQPLPTEKRHGAFMFDSYDQGCAALRVLAQDLGKGVIPDVCRLSDEEETAVNLGHAGRAGTAMLRYARLRGRHRPALLICVWEGTDASTLRARQRASERALRRAGGVRMPSVVATSWEKHRFDGPYARDVLLAHHVLADTLETATTWDNLGALHDRVGAAIRGALEVEGRRAVVMCHVSHVYAAGASLYYTFVSPEAADPLAQWQSVKDAACAAIIEGGGTITHHHAVGRDHRAWAEEEAGDLGVRTLRAVKRELDPVGVMNPGALIAVDASTEAGTDVAGRSAATTPTGRDAGAAASASRDDDGGR